MGTRHLIAVQQGGEYVVAQYGQWDGHICTAGQGVLVFLRSANLDRFRERLLNVSFVTEAEGTEIETKYPNGAWAKEYPWLSRDHGYRILTTIMEAEKPLKLNSTLVFAGNSLFCEWAYVVDLDRNTFEIYQGFNEDETDPKSRFPSGAPWLQDDRTDGYHPVKLVASYSLDALPTAKDLRDLEEAIEEGKHVYPPQELPDVEIVPITRARHRSVRV